MPIGEAVVEEWQRFKLTDYVDCLCCQDSGTKALCIEKLKSLGYENDHILMVGDAPGDMAAAKSNDVYFYPILVRHEKESWEELKTKGISKLTELDYKEYGQVKEQEFIDNLK